MLFVIFVVVIFVVDVTVVLVGGWWVVQEVVVAGRMRWVVADVSGAGATFVAGVAGVVLIGWRLRLSLAFLLVD